MTVSKGVQYCPQCKEDLPLAAFYARHHGKAGNYCVDCSRAYKRRWYCEKRGLPRHSVFIRMPPLPKRPNPARPKSTAYRDVHKRIQRARGAANSHQCVGVKCTKVAACWAYDHTDPKEITALVRGYTIAYSTDPTRYLPLCRSCHSRFDAGSAPRTLLVAAEAWAATRT